VKLVAYTLDGPPRYGAVVDGGIVDLSARLGAECPDLQALMAASDLAAVLERVAGGAPDYGLDDVRYLPPIARPGKILCIGVNYRNRNEEYRDASDAPQYPSVFVRTPASLTAHREPILRPPESEQFDYEGEIAIVMGRRGRRIAEADALRHIGALTCANEGTLRDWVRHGKFNVTPGKNFVASGAIGPWLATADGFADFTNLRVRTRVNGELRQDDTTASLAFPFAYLVAYISTFTELEPGDLILTGTPTGAGARFDPPKWLVPGDVVEVEVDGVGTLSNPVADERVTA
jgi:2-keto-4-pentenoate hydratase/2-oxohepta-3-ene-1,7-dioic acid hydratase in catechol pathway